MIPLCLPHLDGNELKKVEEVLASGWLTEGPCNAEFERRLADYLGVKEAVSLNSCTSALFLALKALDIRGEVILPSFTFVASANAVVTAGATPVFADIEADTCNLDPDDVERRITGKTQAILPVHYAGQCCDMDRILEIARRYDLQVIEDSAETLGGKYRGKMAGSFATGCFSFFPTKNITTGEGGLLSTDDPDLAARVRTLAGHGIPRSAYRKEGADRPWYRSAVLPGYNFRMSNILAAIGLVQMEKIDRLNSLRRSHARYLTERLSEVEEIIPPNERPGCEHVYQMYTIRLQGVNRDGFLRRLRESGVGASVHFDPPVHLQEYYRGLCGEYSLPVTEEIAGSIVTLPLYPQIRERELDRIVEAVEACVLKELDPVGARSE